MQHFQFLIEDKSSEELIRILMSRLILDRDDMSFDCKPFKGLGKLPKEKTINAIKTGKLLQDLGIYLSGFDKRLGPYGKSAVIIIVLDNDNRNPEVFKNEIVQIARRHVHNVEYAVCLAIEEVEAWLLGDYNAILRAYPNARISYWNSYVQDSICNTWEHLADVIYPGGYQKMKKDCPTYKEIGAIKSEWAKTIGSYMDIDNNRSPSFNSFISEISTRICS